MKPLGVHTVLLSLVCAEHPLLVSPALRTYGFAHDATSGSRCLSFGPRAGHPRWLPLPRGRDRRGGARGAGIVDPGRRALRVAPARRGGRFPRRGAIAED